MKTSMKVEGLAELAKGLQQFKKSTQTGVLSRVLKRAAKPVEDAARRNAPVDSGELRDSITTEVIRTNAGKAAFARTMAEGGSRADATRAARDANRAYAAAGTSATVRVRAAAWYSHFVEWGTRKASAVPFLGPAIRQNERPAVKSIAADLKSEITKTAARIARRAAKRKSS